MEALACPVQVQPRLRLERKADAGMNRRALVRRGVRVESEDQG